MLGRERVGHRGVELGHGIARQELGEDVLGVGLEDRAAILAAAWPLSAPTGRKTSIAHTPHQRIHEMRVDDLDPIDLVLRGSGG